MIINQRFPDANGTTTYNGAFARIQKFLNIYDGDDSDQYAEIAHKIRIAVILREDGTYIAVAVLRPEEGSFVSQLTNMNICVC